MGGNKRLKNIGCSQDDLDLMLRQKEMLFFRLQTTRDAIQFLKNISRNTQKALRSINNDIDQIKSERPRLTLVVVKGKENVLVHAKRGRAVLSLVKH